jgi:hypothetical protein
MPRTARRSVCDYADSFLDLIDSLILHSRALLAALALQVADEFDSLLIQAHLTAAGAAGVLPFVLGSQSSALTQNLWVRAKAEDLKLILQPCPRKMLSSKQSCTHFAHVSLCPLRRSTQIAGYCQPQVCYGEQHSKNTKFAVINSARPISRLHTGRRIDPQLK